MPYSKHLINSGNIYSTIDRILWIGRAIPIRKICFFLSLEISFQIVCAFSFSQIRWNPLSVREDRHAKIRGREAVGKEGGRNKRKNGRLVAESEVWLWQKNLSYAATRPISPIGSSAFAFSPRSVILNQTPKRRDASPYFRSAKITGNIPRRQRRIWILGSNETNHWIYGPRSMTNSRLRRESRNAWKLLISIPWDRVERISKEHDAERIEISALEVVFIERRSVEIFKKFRYL